MDIVVDASTIIAVVTNEPTKSKLVELTKGAQLMAPGSIHWEIGNAFSAMLRRKRVTLAQAHQAFAAYRQITVRFVDVEVEDSLHIADSLNIYAYDAYLIRCALKYNAPLLTLDKGLAHSAGLMKVKVVEIES
jgi:predicted nucleic acid-binding protein